MTQLLLHDNMLGTRRQGEMNRTFIYELMIIYFHYLLSILERNYIVAIHNLLFIFS